MPRTLIIGYGNPLRSDDGLGWFAAQRLAEIITAEDVEILPTHQLTPELAEKISRVDSAIFIDADLEGTPGTVRCRLTDSDSPQTAAFTHHLSPEALLACARVLYGKSPPGYLFSVTGENFEYGEGLSATVRAALPALVESVTGLVRSL